MKDLDKHKKDDGMYNEVMIYGPQCKRIWLYANNNGADQPLHLHTVLYTLLLIDL